LVELSEEHRIFQRTVRDFCERDVRPLVEEAESSARFPRDSLLPRMGELGFFRIRMAPESGGAGGDALMQCLFAEELASVCGGFAVSVLPSVIGPEFLVRLGTAEQRAEWMEPLMAGRSLAAIALTEPDAGSDLMAIRTVARREGDGWVLDGCKTFITNGPTADLFLVAAVLAELADRHGLERAAGISLFLVPGDAPGLVRTRRLEKLGMHSSETGELVFESCRLPASGRLAGRGANLLSLMKVLDHSRMYVASISLGLARAAFEASCAYARERKSFGKPIGQHQAIAFKLARMAVDLDAARLLVHRAATLHERGKRCTKEVSMAKLFATEAAVRITGAAIQIHGGYGYMTELPVERYFRDAKVGTIWEGTSEIQQLLIARELGFAP
jgi:alkylation response protein AidB-like acyl-CoA dehydrogenase